MHRKLGEGLEAVVHGRRSYREREEPLVTCQRRSTATWPPSGISAATRRAYAADLRDFAAWYGERPLEQVDVRVLADYIADLGRARPGGKLAPATISRRLSAVRSLLRFSLGRGHVPDVPLGSAPRPAPAGRAEGGRGRRAARRLRTATSRSRSATARCSSSSTRRACGARRRSASISPTSTSSRSACTSATARARKDRVVPLGEEAAHWIARYLREARPELARGAVDALFLSARGRRLDTSTLRRLRAASASPPPLLRDAPARGRRRPARDPGAPRPLVALDDADLQPRERQAAPPGLRPGASAPVARSRQGARRASPRSRAPRRSPPT